MNPERLMSLCAEHGVDFKAVSAATGGERWSAADAALACGPYRSRSGRIVTLPKPCEYAFRYRWARDLHVYGELKGYLLMEAVELKERERWPKKVKRLQLATAELADERYVEDLVDLALIEEHHLHVLRLGDLWSAFMRVEPFVWDRKLSRPYEALRAKVDFWCSDAHSHMARRLRDGDQ